MGYEKKEINYHCGEWIITIAHASEHGSWPEDTYIGIARLKKYQDILTIDTYMDYLDIGDKLGIKWNLEKFEIYHHDEFNYIIFEPDDAHYYQVNEKNPDDIFDWLVEEIKRYAVEVKWQNNRLYPFPYHRN